LEGQIADIADRIAYNCHDLEDGLRSRLLDLSELTGLALYKLAEKKIALDRIHDYVIRRTRLVKTIMDILASDVIETSRKKINEASIVRLEQVYEHPHPLIGLSDSIHTALCQLETFLMQNMYLDPTIRQTAEKAQDWLAALFEDLCLCPDKMPHFYRQMIASQGLYRVVCDYIAGMTDRYCLQLALPLTQ